ncbi:MAG: DUF6516 family protein [Acetobacteraceae bacterium]
MERLLDFHRRRYWLTNGWCIRLRVWEVPSTHARPHGLRYSFTLHDMDMARLLGFDNAHGISRRQAYDHRHPFRRPATLVRCDYVGADELICDFFDEIEKACRSEGVAFEFEAAEVELEDEDDEGLPDSAP